MIQVVGGVYLELCLEPHWDNLFGSGGRAAAALSELRNDVSLSTYIGTRESEYLDQIARTFGFSLDTIQTIPETTEFTYFHCLSDPSIRPPLVGRPKHKSLIVHSENVIRYGFLEGDAVVTGKNVVYDPQNDRNAELFSANGSTAERLAIVANTNECQKLASLPGETDAVKLGRTLIDIEGAEVVVVKQGSLGSTVVTQRDAAPVPVFRTDKVFSIGSGDIFTSVFGHFWMSGGNDVIECAHLASKATAHYCETRMLPIPSTFDTEKTYRPVERRSGYYERQIYLAGPFFSMSERWLIDECRKYFLAEGINVFSPFHEVGFGHPATVAPADIDGLKKSDLVFAVLDGTDPGTIFEVGYAIASGLPVIVYVQNASPKDLTMVEGTGCEIIRDFTSAIYRAVWEAIER